MSNVISPRRRATTRWQRAITMVVHTASAAVVLLWLLLVFDSDASPLGMLLAFAPRWWLLLPWAVLLPLATVAGRRTVLVGIAGVLLTALGIARFELPAWRAAPPPRAMRLLTYNADLSTGLAFRLRDAVNTWQADVILLQDCKTIVFDSLQAIFPSAVAHGRFCFASRWPLVDVADAVDLATPQERRIERFRDAVRFRVRTPFGVVPVYSVHLPSPRDALSAARWLNTEALLPALRHSIRERGGASAAVSAAVDRSDSAFVVAGDFNLPYGSRLLERDWGDLTNAFAESGSGFGHTMTAGVYSVRIDHVLLSPSLVPITAHVLSGYLTEHQPVIVDIAQRLR